GRRFDGSSRFAIRTEPLRPFFAGIFGVSGADVEFKTRLIGAIGFCAVGSGRAPPFDAPPLRKKLRVKGTRFVSAFGFVLGAKGAEFSGIGRAQNYFSPWVACDACNLRGAGFCELREYAAAVHGK